MVAAVADEVVAVTERDTEWLTDLAKAEMRRLDDERIRDRETRKICRTCRHYRRTDGLDQCAHGDTRGWDPVNGPITVLRDCREYRRSFTEVGSHPIHNNCGLDALFWEPIEPPKALKPQPLKDFL